MVRDGRRGLVAEGAGGLAAGGGAEHPVAGGLEGPGGGVEGGGLAGAGDADDHVDGPARPQMRVDRPPLAGAERVAELGLLRARSTSSTELGATTGPRRAVSRSMVSAMVCSVASTAVAV